MFPPCRRRSSWSVVPGHSSLSAQCQALMRWRSFAWRSPATTMETTSWRIADGDDGYQHRLVDVHGHYRRVLAVAGPASAVRTAYPCGLGKSLTMPSHVAASPSSAMIAAPSVFSDMATSLCQRIGRGRAWRCRRRSTLCSCAVRALSTGARIGDGAAVPVAALPEGHHRSRLRRSHRSGVTGGQVSLSEKSGEQGLLRKIVVPRMGMRHGRLGELPYQTGGTWRRSQRPSTRRRGRRAPVIAETPIPASVTS